MNNVYIDITHLLKEKFPNYPRVKNRYNSSELWAITHNYLSPEEWLKPKEKKTIDFLRMHMGILVHKFIQDLLPIERNEVKKEIQYKDICLVAKADHLPVDSSDEVWEIKSSDEEMVHSKPWAEYQAKLYASIFEKSLGRILQPVKNNEGLYLKVIGEVKRDDSWFKGELEKLVKFNEQVEILRTKI